MFFFFNDTATAEIYTLSLHDALPILGRLWTSFVIVFGVSGFLYMLSEIGAELVEFRVYKENQKKRKIRKMKNHYIICGYGRMGAVIARELHEKIGRASCRERV